MTTGRPTSVEVTFDASGLFGTADFWGERPKAVKVQWRAGVVADGHLAVSVTAYTSTHRNHSWYDPRHFVADGLDQSPPPAWVPEAPEWFWAAAEGMDQSEASA
ncbi:hypothetical protein [Nocardioides sp.]|uniref:hypothetical protein n=1 Tax=Nocardioides sp. TaxID=35761 RepID=UPI002BB5F34B|nr:hypothetical protein [Nocardioides sp.]HXH77283.1 hypothetical protein [Nocardioides sp.]